MKVLLLTAIVLSFVGCTSNSEKDKYQKKRDNIVDVSGYIKELDTGEVLIGSVSRLYVGNEYLCIADHKTSESSIHLFSLSDYQHISSCGTIGPGPDEITILGHVEIDEKHNKMYVSDHGKYRIFSYDLDSLVLFPDSYKHQTKVKIGNTSFPDSYCYVNDTLSYARVIKPTSVSTFEQGIGKWNMQTGEIKMMDYSHPDVEQKRSLFDVSLNHNFYAEVYMRHDLMSICDLDGSLICNIYGPDWNGGGRTGFGCYGGVVITEKYIMALYSGNSNRSTSRSPKLLLFDLKGDYIKSLELKCNVKNFCYNPKRNSVVMSLDDDIQFGELDLDDLGL